VPRGVSGLRTIRSAVPLGAATSSSTIAATIRDRSGHVEPKAAAPCAPVVPPSVETSTSPRSGGMSASVRASWTSMPVPAASPPVEPSRWAMTAMICRDVPGR